MSFKFNFPEPSPSSQELQTHFDVNKPDLLNAPREAIEILPNFTQIEQRTNLLEFLTCTDGTIITFIQNNENNGTCLMTGTQCDLIPGVYEGGLQIWECSVDVVNYLSSLDISFRGLTVLELGCGVGLPGLYTLHKGADVHFQDYNAEVIKTRTIPNVSLNGYTRHDQTPRFFSGDWRSLRDLMVSQNLRFDMILTSETIYNCENYAPLVALFDALLKPCGTIYVAAKVHYFGIGGGTHLFQDYVKKTSQFDVTIVHTIKAGHKTGLQREILLLKRREHFTQR